MKTANRNRSLFLRTALVAIPLAFASLAPVSAMAEPRPTPVPHNGSLMSFVSQHSASNLAPTCLSRGATQSHPGAQAKDPKPASRDGANESHTHATGSADGPISRHSREWRLEGGLR